MSLPSTNVNRTTSINYQALVADQVRQLEPYVPGKSIEELERETGIASDDIIKLASNESAMPANPRVISAIQAALPSIVRYPDGNGFHLKQKICNRFGITLDGLTLGNGSNDLLVMAAQAFLKTGRNAVFSQYAFSVYASATVATGAEAREVPAIGWGHDLGGMLDSVDENTRLIFIANPNNPTGTWFGRLDFDAFMARVPAEIIVVLDEAYIEYADDPSLPNGLDYLKEFPNLIVCRSMSKAYGLAGLRVGYAASSSQIAGILNRVRQPFNVNSLALAGACAAINDEAYLTAGRKMNRQGLEQLYDGLIGLGLSWIPSRTNFIAVDFYRPAGAICEALLGMGIIVRPLVGYGMPNHLRVSVGSPTENDRLLEALRQILALIEAL